MIEWRLHEIMGKKRLRIADVARLAGLTWNTVGDIYHGRTKSVSLETLDRLCSALGCQPGDLLAYVPTKKGGTADEADR
ncbi:MAG: helix-turn-helix domain-containing protein [Desulfofundulus sp.]